MVLVRNEADDDASQVLVLAMDNAKDFYSVLKTLTFREVGSCSRRSKNVATVQIIIIVKVQ